MNSRVSIAVIIALIALATTQDTCECPDTPPPNPNNYTCDEQSIWEKCGEDWMSGYCECTCGTCGFGPIVEEEGDVLVETEVIPGEPVEPGMCDERDEPLNCALSRERCCLGCTSEAETDFSCQQIGFSFASSCSCASGGAAARGRAFSRAFSRRGIGGL
eukprot:TRINITY_DN53753_c0_g1_i1.p3 TRINITY_DN53753_c0_g1~~TRINITY_DN53753_c0_g1_i1.p3  ORF type:complete len:160 (-),score=30.24 TRINITY_DN53753_c0_g1_i1:308-787(-)